MKFGPNIVTNGLVVYQDAGDSLSWNGTVLNDMSAHSMSGVLGSSVTFSPSSGRYFNFPGTTNDANNKIELPRNDSIVGNGLSAITVEMWVAPSNTNIVCIATNSSSYNNCTFYFFQETSSVFSFLVGASGGYDGRQSNYTYNGDNLNKWVHIVGTWPALNDTGRVDFFANAQLSNGTNLGGAGTRSAPMINGDSGIRWGLRTNNTTAYQGRAAVLRIYNRVLSNSEILQNFNAQKGRFGL